MKNTILMISVLLLSGSTLAADISGAIQNPAFTELDDLIVDICSIEGASNKFSCFTDFFTINSTQPGETLEEVVEQVVNSRLTKLDQFTINPVKKTDIEDVVLTMMVAADVIQLDLIATSLQKNVNSLLNAKVEAYFGSAFYKNTQIGDYQYVVFVKDNRDVMIWLAGNEKDN